MEKKKILLWVNLLFFAALLGFSVTFFMNNITWEPNNAPIEAAYAHIGQGKAIYRIGLGATGIYKIGHLALLYFFLTKKITFSLPQILLYFAAQAGGCSLWAAGPCLCCYKLSGAFVEHGGFLWCFDCFYGRRANTSKH